MEEIEGYHQNRNQGMYRQVNNTYQYLSRRQAVPSLCAQCCRKRSKEISQELLNFLASQQDEINIQLNNYSIRLNDFNIPASIIFMQKMLSIYQLNYAPRFPTPICQPIRHNHDTL